MTLLDDIRAFQKNFQEALSPQVVNGFSNSVKSSINGVIKSAYDVQSSLNNSINPTVINQTTGQVKSAINTFVQPAYDLQKAIRDGWNNSKI